eukprot:1384753-Amorphochlora_amoeboformis.AAC.1
MAYMYMFQSQGAGSMSYFRMDLKNSNQSITTRNLRDKVIFTRNYKVDFEGQREKGKKTGLFPFTVVGPGCSWKLATKSAEESRAWVEEIQQAISSSPEQAPSKLNGQHRQNVPGIQTSPRTSQKVPTSRESRDVSPKRRQHKRTYTNPLPNVRFSNTRAVTGNCRTSPPMSPILSSALVLRSGQPSPMTTYVNYILTPFPLLAFLFTTNAHTPRNPTASTSPISRTKPTV